MNQSNTTALVALFAGFILLYGAIKNRNPLEVIKGALNGKQPSSAGALQK